MLYGNYMKRFRKLYLLDIFVKLKSNIMRDMYSLKWNGLTCMFHKFIQNHL